MVEPGIVRRLRVRIPPARQMINPVGDKTPAPDQRSEGTTPSAGAKPAGEACARCPGRHASIVLPEPAARSDGRVALAIVGEAPGRTELIEKRPFVGRSGQMLERGLRTLGL